MLSPRRPTELQLNTVEPIDAVGAFLYALCSLKTPDYLVLQHALPAVDFNLHVIGFPPMALEEALTFLGAMHDQTGNLGQNHRTTELVFSDHGLRMACLDKFELSPQAIALCQLRSKFEPFQPSDQIHFSGLIFAHYVRLVEFHSTHKIAEWRISNKHSDFNTLLA